MGALGLFTCRPISIGLQPSSTYAPTTSSLTLFHPPSTVRYGPLRCSETHSSSGDDWSKFREAVMSRSIRSRGHLTPETVYRCLVKGDERDAPSLLFESVEPGLHQDEIVKMIDEQKQPDVANRLLEEQISVEVLGKRSGYLKGYEIQRSAYGAQSQGVPNSEVVALKQQVADQGKVLADYGKKLEKMMLMLATGVDPASIPGLIQSSENRESTSGGEQNGTFTS